MAGTEDRTVPGAIPEDRRNEISKANARADERYPTDADLTPRLRSVLRVAGGKEVAGAEGEGESSAGGEGGERREGRQQREAGRRARAGRSSRRRRRLSPRRRLSRWRRRLPRSRHRVDVLKLPPRDAELLYLARFAGVEFFPRDIDAVLSNPGGCHGRSGGEEEPAGVRKGGGRREQQQGVTTAGRGGGGLPPHQIRPRIQPAELVRSSASGSAAREKEATGEGSLPRWPWGRRRLPARGVAREEERGERGAAESSGRRGRWGGEEGDGGCFGEWDSGRAAAERRKNGSVKRI
uniref:Uncharacterized protein n=1 Tax=Setaria viridis TaxID=4556 RepID=A0A4V6D243_SETVI|nr:hypothetical protein SEVIR_9G474200v2 [Setaria viridis]